jgi:uncharacterized surface protein with fasciclin (FAS1) repeats
LKLILFNIFLCFGKQITINSVLTILINSKIFEAMKLKMLLMTMLLSIHALFAQNNVYEVIQGSPNHTILLQAINLAGLDEALQGDGPFTVFAPTDDAFLALDEELLNGLLADPEGALTQVLLYHVLGAEVFSGDLSDGLEVETLQGSNVTVTIDGDGNVFINGNSQVTAPDIGTGNGVVHVVNGVLVPQDPDPVTVASIVANSPDHTVLLTALVAAELFDVLDDAEGGPFTLFAPTDAAFGEIDPAVLNELLEDPTGALAQILLYHVVSGSVASGDLSDGMVVETLQGQSITVTIDEDGNVFINEAQVTVADLVADNGIVHVIDAVLLPGAEETTTVADIISGSPDHTVLLTALVAAELFDVLDDAEGGPFTVFAPTDAAFGEIDPAVLNELLEDPTGALAQILLYHVVSGSVASGDLSDGMVVETLQGQSITVTIDEDGNVFINEAQVTVADLVADNGIVHVIDAVLLPEVVETTTVADIISGSPDHTVLLTALVAAELFDVLDDAEGGPFTVFAPTDAAFGEIDPAVLNELLEDPTGALAQILLYHVVSGSVASEDLSDGMVVETLQGQSITVTIDEDGNVFINEAQVTVADLVADNGIVHVIDAVLLPEIVNTFTVADIISGSPDHTVLLTALVAADLLDVLDDADGDFTVFAPTDAAFAALPPGLIEALLQDPTGLLSEILLFHVVGGTALSSDLADGQFLYPLGGGVINVSISGGVVRVNGAQVTVADLVADNGVVHVIDAVLLPLPCLSFVEGPYNDFNAQFGGAPSPDENGNCETFTITDFEAWASEIYVVDNFRQGVTYTFSICEGPNAGSWPAELTVFDANQQLVAFELNNCSITWVAPADGTYFIGINEAGACGASSTNLTVNNGNPSLTCQGEARNTVFDIIFNSPDHNTLTAVLELSGLDEALNGEGPFTVFAPTDDAFSLIPEEIIEELIGNPALLVDILLYHVVGDNALSTDLVDGQEITTLNGETVRVTINANGVFINDAQVTVADLVADNGVVHVIDAVLLPPTELPTVFDIISNSPVHTTLATAINAAQLGGTLSGEGPFTVFAPTDEAFAALPEGLLEELLADPAGALTSILLYHVVGGTAFSSDLTNGQSILTLNGESVTIRIEGSSVFVNDAQVIIADLEASNGVVHVINAVLVPEPNAVRNADISTDLEVFPNPAQEQIYIKGQEFGQDASYEIRDMNGRVLRTGFLTPGMGIPVSGMNAGYYLLMITSEKGVKLGKFAKM